MAEDQITKFNKQISNKFQMTNSKPVYDLEERTFQFAKHVRNFVKQLPKTIANIEDGKQVIRSSGSIGANYIEANESLSKRLFDARQNLQERSKRKCLLFEINSRNKSRRCCR